jgi:hypothetical protein
MKFKSIYFFLFSLLFFSCQDNSKELKIEQEKEAKKADAIFKTINKAWVFNTNPLDNSTQNVVNNWSEWNNFLREIKQKPKATIGAFQKKSKTLSKKAEDLNLNIPYKFNLPQVKSRILVLTTKLKELELFINLNQIQEKKVVAIIPEINQEIVALQLQMQEVMRREQIPTEIGEPDRIRMRDTTRLVPNDINENQKKVE